MLPVQQRKFSEVGTIQAEKSTPRQPAIGSLRRNLQRSYLKRLSAVISENADISGDTATVASSELSELTCQDRDFSHEKPS